MLLLFLLVLMSLPDSSALAELAELFFRAIASKLHLTTPK
jgi:hypothetical protein